MIPPLRFAVPRSRYTTAPFGITTKFASPGIRSFQDFTDFRPLQS